MHVATRIEPDTFKIPAVGPKGERLPDGDAEVRVMEPLRGGKLVDLLPKEASEAIAASTCGWSPAELAFRWLYNQPQVTCRD